MRNLIFLLAIGILISVGMCYLLSKVPFIGQFGLIQKVLSYTYLLIPFSVFLLAYYFYPNLIIALVVSAIIAIVINFAIPRGWI